MKRNADLIREIAIATEKLPFNGELRSLEGIDAETFFEHVKLMDEAGLLDCLLIKPFNPSPPEAIITGLTWDGHDFLDAARSDALWKRAKESVIGPTMSWTFSILKEWLKAESKTSLPALRGLGD